MCWGRWHRNWPLSDELDFPAAEGKREKRRKCSEWEEQNEQSLRDLGAQSMFEKNTHNTADTLAKGLPKAKESEWERWFWGSAKTQQWPKPEVKWLVKAPVTPDTHSWLPALPCFPNVSLLPARRTQFKARHIFLFSFSSCVNKEQISPLSCDHELGLYNFHSGASLGGGRVVGVDRRGWLENWLHHMVSEGWAPNSDAVPYTLQPERLAQTTMII